MEPLTNKDFSSVNAQKLSSNCNIYCQLATIPASASLAYARKEKHTIGFRVIARILSD